MDEKHNWVYGAVLKITDDLETNERKANESKQKLIIKKLISKKKKTGQFNVSIDYKGITYGMTIS